MPRRSQRPLPVLPGLQLFQPLTLQLGQLAPVRSSAAPWTQETSSWVAMGCHGQHVLRL